MQEYIKNGIAIIKETTKELDDLNKLCIYLSRQIDINALKCLKLIILAQTTNEINLPLNINSPTYLFENRLYQKQENTIGNLSMNPQNFALDLMDYLVKNYPVDLNFLCYKNNTILKNWLKSFENMDKDDSDPFYKRYDMIDTKLEIIEFVARNHLLEKTQIEELISTYLTCINAKNHFTKEQKNRMQYLIEQLQQYYKIQEYISTLDINKESAVIDHLNFLANKFLKSKKSLYQFSVRQTNALQELKNYNFDSDQCVYMLNEFPKIIRKI